MADPDAPAAGHRLGGHVAPGDRARERRGVVGDRLLTALAIVSAVVVAAGSALVEAVLTSRTIGPLPVSMLLAIAGNAALSWYAMVAVARPWAVWVPASTWVATMVALSIRTAEGDLLLPGTGAAVVTVFAGMLTFAVPIARGVARRR